MPRIRRPDGAEIHWEERGEGPLVVFATQFFGYPEIFEALIDELATDHRVVLYHVRGTGKSSRVGPYELDVDADDLAGLLEDLGEPAVLVPMADGTIRSVKAALQCPELAKAIVSPGGNPVGRGAIRDSDGLAGSDSVIDALVGMMEADYRTALRTMVDTANPQLEEGELRERVDRSAEFCPREAALPRLRQWVEEDATEEARAFGDRLWILEHGQNPWFPIGIVERTRELLPEAHVEPIEDGPISRPDITASFIRQVTADERVTQASGGGQAA
jgi:3-oxoadipate enol-lactonase